MFHCLFAWIQLRTEVSLPFQTVQLVYSLIEDDLAPLAFRISEVHVADETPELPHGDLSDHASHGVRKGVPGDALLSPPIHSPFTATSLAFPCHFTPPSLLLHFLSTEG